jgi:localization factor PodJL
MTSGVPRQASGADQQAHEDTATPDSAQSAASPLEHALAEIAERQRMLDGEEGLQRADLPRAPTQRFDGLEQQLRSINARIDSLPPCGIASAVETLRDDLAEIGLMIKEAMPRHAIEAIETEIRALAQRVDGTRHAGVDATALAGIERALAEVRDALRALMPAERLAGVDEAVGALSQKIDRAAASPGDPVTLEQIESAIVGLRGIVSHVASTDALAKLSEDVRALAAKVERVADSDVLATLEQRIATMADALQARHRTAGDAHDLGALVQGLSDKLEQLHLTRTAHGAAAAVENHIARLVEKLDASDARTHDSIEAVQGTLRYVVDRLAVIEAGPHSDHAAEQPNAPTSAAPAALAPAVPPAPRAPAPTETSEPGRVMAAMPVAATASSNPAPATDRRPIDPDLPPDHPLEPGAARGRGHSPADRIAASEAALGPSRPQVVSDPGSKSDFIAAARRAAQAASSAAGGRDDKNLSRRSASVDAEPASQVGNHIRTLLVGGSIVLILLGSLQLLTGLFSGSDLPAPRDQIAQAAPSGSSHDARAEPETVPEMPPSSSPSDHQPALVPGAVPFTSSSAGLFLPGEPAQSAAVAPPRSPQPSPEPAVTGSVRAPSPPPPPAAAPSPPPTSAPIPLTPPQAGRLSGVDKLPSTIGSNGLRAAAAKGDPAAEFEIAVRFAEGRGVPRDLAAAAQWFERAARQGLPLAQFRLGGLHEKGIGVRKDLDRARRLYLAAAQAGNAKAMHNLAVLYAEGVDGKPDYQAAAKWFRKAAEHGVADSQYNLGILYARGIGIEANLAEAFKWFSLAARQGDRDSAKKRDDVGARLDQATATAARAAVEAWTAEPQPEAATQVKAPPGGWDGGTAPTTAKRRVGPDAKAPRATQ